jgi:hypothetical protein
MTPNRRSTVLPQPSASFSSLSPVHVIKKCSHLEAPAIFFSFKDCQFYLDLQDDRDEEASAEDYNKERLEKAWEYDLFDTVEEALAFLRSDEKPLSSSSSSPPPRRQNQDDDIQSNDESDDKNNQNEKRKRNEQEEEDDYETKRMKRLLHRDRQSSHQRHIQVFEKNMALLQQFKQDYGDCDIPHSRLEYDSLDTSTGYTKDGGGTIAAFAYTGLTDTTLKTAATSSSAPPRIRIDWGKYDGLRGWVCRIRQQIEMYLNAATRESSILTVEQVRRLFDVGFVMEPRRNKPPDTKPLDKRLIPLTTYAHRQRAYRFEKNLARLQEFKHDYGHCDVPFQNPDSVFGKCSQKQENESSDNTCTENGGGCTSGGGAASQVATTTADVSGGDNDGDRNSGTNTGETGPTRTTATASAVAQPLPPRSTIDWEKYDGLGRWVRRMRLQIKKYQTGVSCTSSKLTGEQVQRLLNVGLVMVPRQHSRYPVKSSMIQLQSMPPG